MRVNGRLLALVAAFAFSGCVTHQESAPVAQSAYRPVFVATTPTDKNTDYYGQRARVQDGQDYVCEQQYVRFVDEAYQKREVCFTKAVYEARAIAQANLPAANANPQLSPNPNTGWTRSPDGGWMTTPIR
jgi:hypothetical protein